MKQRSTSRVASRARSTSVKRAPKKLQAIQTSRHLHVAQHRHTGRVLPRRSTSYPMLVMIVLCVGVFLGSWTHFASAATDPNYLSPSPYPSADTMDETVNARVPGPAPTLGATIDVPTSGKHFQAAPITVTGSCPADTYIEITRNGYFSGTALCQADGSYSLSTDLFYGSNVLLAHDFNYTDVAGPVSDPVTVYLDAPVVPVAPIINNTGDIAPSTTPSKSTVVATSGFSTNSTATPTPTATNALATVNPLLLKTGFAFQGYTTGEQIIWQLDVEGGSEPYAIAVDWGDGTHGIVSQAANGSFRINHTYSKPGGYHGSYIVKFSATDSSGSQTFLQLLAIVNNQPTAVGVTHHSVGSGLGLLSGSGLHNIVTYVWPSYGVVVLMLFSFWLGERREFKYLSPRLRLQGSLKALHPTKKTRHA